MPEPSPTPVELFCRDEGNGPALLFVHGVGGSHTVWNLVLAGLGGRYRALAPDLRGHGRSPAPPGAVYGFEELEADLVQLLDGKRIETVHLVGLSAGALLALKTALDRPQRVRSLTLIAGSVYSDNHTKAVSDRWAETYNHDGPDGLALRLLKDLYYPDWIEEHMEVADQVREQMRSADFRGPALWAREAVRFDERPRIAQLRVPTLLIQAMDDQVVDPAHGRILRQSIPSAQLRILAQTGHMVPVERPRETVEALVAFVDSVEKGRSPAASA